MNKQSLRSLATGFLISGLILGSYLYLFPENEPQISTTDTEVLASLESENESLKDEQLKLNDQIANLTDSRSTDESAESDESSSRRQSNESESSNSSRASSSRQDDESQTTTDNEDDSIVETDDDGLAMPETVGTFTVSEGNNATEIAQELESEGYIDSAEEFIQLIEEWDLTTEIVSGDYTINSDMTIHDIANIITQGSYYYY